MNQKTSRTDQAATPAVDNIVSMSIDESGYPRTGDTTIDRMMCREVDRIVEDRFRAQVHEWARSNCGRLRTRGSLRTDVAAEFITLAEALGPWALVNSDEIFPDRLRTERPHPPRP